MSSSSTAVVFPGQGSQVVGMGLQFYKDFNIVKKIFEEADNKLKFKISKTACFPS